MEKKQIKITEDKLRQLVNECVKRAINEANMGACSELTQCTEILTDLENSGFIPFASPSPSSTEYQVKMNILQAHQLLDKAIQLCKSLGYGN